MIRYFDITDVLLYVEKESTVSGIQRVSFEVIRSMVQRFGPEAVRIAYWDRKRREYLGMPSDFIAQMEEFDPDILSAVFFGARARMLSDTPPSLERYRNRPAKYWFHYARRMVNAYKGNERHFERAGTTLADWQAFRAGVTPPEKPQGFGGIPRVPVAQTAQPGDPLIVLGATWAIDGLEDSLRALKEQNGVVITQMIHDLIPLRVPEHVNGDFIAAFYRWLRALPEYCSHFLANSQNTARDLAAFLAEVDRPRPIEVVPLAQEFTEVSVAPIEQVVGPDGPFKQAVERSLTLRREILNLTKVPYVLVVGTIESRKNGWRLAQAWQRLAREEGLEMPRLVFAGRPGWLNEDFDGLMAATGNLGGWVQFALRPSDAELAYLYRNSLFTATVSLYEGWGLPIGESLHFGKTAVVAENSAMPEVGGDMVEYCDAHSLRSIQAACRRLIADPEHRRALEARIAATRLRRWDDVAGDIVEILSREGRAGGQAPVEAPPGARAPGRGQPDALVEEGAD